MVTQPNCPWCDKATTLLQGLGLNVEKTVLDTPQKKAAFKSAGFDTVPQIYINDIRIGGHDDLVAMLLKGLTNAEG
jgi:glutaredoxin